MLKAFKLKDILLRMGAVELHIELLDCLRTLSPALTCGQRGSVKSSRQLCFRSRSGELEGANEEPIYGLFSL